VLIKIHEGKKHVVRKLFQYSGHTVRQLKRTAIGPFKLGSLHPGEYRQLSTGEVEKFKRITGFQK
jgi:23S rRNA pseudouridine2605 synthase